MAWHLTFTGFIMGSNSMNQSLNKAFNTDSIMLSPFSQRNAKMPPS
ncbi:MAG: hypothetical protein ACI9MF_002604, partial [Gammaproteobacteria bacterium]